MLDAKTFPTEEQTVSRITGLHFPTIRDQLMADILIPGIDEPMDRVLRAQTHSKPHWSRVEWAAQLLLHAYTRSSTRHSAPILTAIAFINWWEGRGSKAHQLLHLAIEAGPAYRPARLSEVMICSGSSATSCRYPAFLHEQVSKRGFWTGRNPRSIQRIVGKSCCTWS